MKAAVLLLQLLASCAALPAMHWDFFADKCTGSGDPKAAAPYCYSGKASVLGGAFSEGVVVTVDTYADGKGTMDFDATGAAHLSCKGRTFTKTGQDLDFDVSSCLGGGVVKAQ